MKFIGRIFSILLCALLMFGFIFSLNNFVNSMSLFVKINDIEYSENIDGIHFQHNTFVSVSESEYDINIYVRKLPRDFTIRTIEKEYQWSRIAKANSDITDNFVIKKSNNGFSVDYDTLFSAVGFSGETVTNLSEISAYSLFDLVITSKFDKLTIGFTIDLTENYIALNELSNELIDFNTSIAFVVNQNITLSFDIFSNTSLNCTIINSSGQLSKTFSEGVHSVYFNVDDIVILEMDLLNWSDGILDYGIQYDDSNTFTCVANYDFEWYGKNYFNASSISFRAVESCKVCIHLSSNDMTYKTYVNGVEGFTTNLNAGDTFSIRSLGSYAGKSTIVTRYFVLSSTVSSGFIDLYNDGIDKLPDGNYDYSVPNYNFLVSI